MVELVCPNCQTRFPILPVESEGFCSCGLDYALRADGRVLWTPDPKFQTSGTSTFETSVSFPDPDPELPTSGPLTKAELHAAEKRIAPYLRGYPEPMIDIRRLRIANGTASVQDEREIRAEDAVRRHREGGRLR